MLLALLACRPAADSQPSADTTPESRTETGIVVLDDSAENPQDAVEHVIVLVMDGARMDESFGSGLTSNTTGEASEDFMPAVRSRLFPQGTLVLPGLSTGVTTTAPGHCDMMIGTNTPYGNYGVDASTRDPGLYRPEYPTLLEAARSQRGVSDDGAHFGANAALMVGLTWSLHPRLGEEVGGEYTFVADPGNEEAPLADDVPTLEALQAHLDEHEGTIVFWNLKNVDRTGHYGPPQAYPESTKVIDEPIADFWDWLQASETYAGNTVLIITSDHGRHRFDTEEDWRQHGDACAGCRQIPMFFIGPNFEEGITITDPVTMHDMSQTIADLLELEMPHSTGKSLFGNSAEGSLEIAQADVQALGTYVDGRPQVTIDGEVVSSGWAEGPVAISQDGVDTVCWREISVEDPDSAMPWVPRCLNGSDGDWTDIGFADEPEVSPWWSPTLQVDSGGQLWGVYADTKHGVIARPADATKAVRVVRWSEARGWEGMGNGTNDFSLATHPTLALGEDFAWVAFASADAGTTDRSSRHIKVFKVVWNPAENPIWNKVLDTQGTGRMERPVLGIEDGEVHLAYLLSREEFGNTVMTKACTDSCDTWTEAERLDADGRVLVHIGPQFHDGAFWWARLGDADTVEVCSHALDAQAPTCTDTGSAWMRDLSVGAEGVFATVSSGDRSWSIWSP